MRGVILEYSDMSGTGLISGEDNVRYTFSASDVRSTITIRTGQKVDFEPGEDGVARAVFILDAGATGADSAPAAGPIPVQHDLPPNHKSLRYGLNPFQFFGKSVGMYFDGRGRATVAEYWSFVLVYYLILIGLAAVAVPLAAASEAGESVGVVFIVLAVVLSLALLIPSITVTIRRLHDIGISGWFILLGLIPYVGGIVLFVMSLIPSQRYTNQYGPYFRDVVAGRTDVMEVFK